MTTEREIPRALDGTDALLLPFISIIIVSYNHKHYLKACLDSLLSQNYPHFEIILVDNHSADQSADFARAEFPMITVIPSETNLGFAGGNNLGAQQAKGEYLAFINPDTISDAQSLTELIQPLLDNKIIGLTTSKLLLMQDKNTINTCGNDVHYTGIAFLRGSGQPADTQQKQQTVGAISGAAFIISKKLFLELGGFDKHFAPAYVEDTDLSWRVILQGKTCALVPTSIVYHDYRPSFSANKYYMIEKNRLQMLLKTYRWGTLLLLLPALLLSEVVSWGYGLSSGRAFLGAKLRSYGWVIRNIQSILHSRRIVQQSRQVGDRELLRACVTHLAYGQASDSLASKVAPILFDPLYVVLYRLYQVIIRW